MPVFLKDDTSVLFIHIPKTGGSSLESNLTELGWKEVFSIRGVPARQLGFIKASPQHFHAELMDAVFDYAQFSKIVAICRDPFNRLKSEFYWQSRQATRATTPQDWIDDMFAQYRQNPCVCDNHIRPQVDFIPKQEEVSIAKLEDDGVRNAQIMICGRYEEPPKTLKQRLKPRLQNKKASKYTPEVESAFEANRAKIVDFYAADYEFLGYEAHPKK